MVISAMMVNFLTSLADSFSIISVFRLENVANSLKVSIRVEL